MNRISRWAAVLVAAAGLVFGACEEQDNDPGLDAGSTAHTDAGRTGSGDGGVLDPADAGNDDDSGVVDPTDGGNNGTTDGGTASSGPRNLLVATSYVPRLVSLTTGATQEVHADKLRWPQGQGHLYPHFDLSPDGKTMVVFHEYGTNAPTADDRLVLYTLDGSAPAKVLTKRTSTLGEFPAAPCHREDGKILVVAQDAVWSIDSSLDHTQTPVKVSAISPGDKLRSPFYWNRECTRLVAVAFKSGDTNTSATNVGWLEATTGALTQISEYAIGGKTLAQQANLPTCTGSGCVTAKSGGTIGSMGWLPDGTIYFKSNRDVWRDNVGYGNFQGEEKFLRYDPAAPQSFDQLATWTGPKPIAISRAGDFYAVVNGASIDIFKADGTKVVTSTDDFNSANVPGFSRFVP